MSTKRDVGVEFFRILLMLGIVCLHVGGEMFGSFSWENDAFTWCVNGFALLTGYFGAKFKLQKVCRLYLDTIICCVVAQIIACLLGQADRNPIMECVNYFTRGGTWFVHSYVIMLAMAPLVNLAMESNHRVELLSPLIIAVFGLGFLASLPVVGILFPAPCGLTDFSPLTLLGMYVLGRFYCVCNFGERLSLRIFVLCFVLSVWACCFGVSTKGHWVSGFLGRYNSPFAALAAITALAVFQRIVHLQDNCFFSRMVILISPSVFSVYVLHTHPGVLSWIHTFRGGE